MCSVRSMSRNSSANHPTTCSGYLLLQREEDWKTISEKLSRKRKRIGFSSRSLLFSIPLTIRVIKMITFPGGDIIQKYLFHFTRVDRKTGPAWVWQYHFACPRHLGWDRFGNASAISCSIASEDGKLSTGVLQLFSWNFTTRSLFKVEFIYGGFPSHNYGRIW